MREAIRRALWIVPTIFLVSVLSFWATARGATAPAAEEGLPLLLNERPVHLGALAWNAALSIAEQRPEGKPAGELLVRLGGATLPHLLPRLDSLSPPDRRRVALALLPIARRMQLPGVAGVVTGEQAETFWFEFWQDHFVDFRATVSRRVVERFANRATSLREEELLRLDTFALPDLMSAMSTTSDVGALHRLCGASAHIAEKPWTIREGASSAEARRVVDAWLGWWARHEGKYTEPVGAARFLAPVLQTRYGLWLTEAFRTRLGQQESGEPILGLLQRTAISTLSLLFLGLVGGSVVGLLLATLLASWRKQSWTRALGALALSWLGVPTAMWIAWLRDLDIMGPRVSAALLVLAAGTAVALLHARAGSRAEPVTPSSIEYARRIAPRALRGIAANASTLLGVVMLVEYGFDLSGWGRETVMAVQQRDVPWLMAIVMVTAVVLGLVHVAVAIGQQLSRRSGVRDG